MLLGRRLMPTRKNGKDVQFSMVLKFLYHLHGGDPDSISLSLLRGALIFLLEYTKAANLLCCFYMTLRRGKQVSMHCSLVESKILEIDLIPSSCSDYYIPRHTAFVGTMINRAQR